LHGVLRALPLQYRREVLIVEAVGTSSVVNEGEGKDICKCGHYYRDHYNGNGCSKDCVCKEWVGVHYHIAQPGTMYRRCYNISGRGDIEREAERIGGTLVVVLDTDCPNGTKPEYIRWKTGK